MSSGVRHRLASILCPNTRCYCTPHVDELSPLQQPIQDAQLPPKIMGWKENLENGGADTGHRCGPFLARNPVN
jgi:hypothetical protein